LNMVRASAGSGPTSGDDVIVGTGGDDVIDTLAGNDIVYANSGSDFIAGGEGADELQGNDGDDQLTGDGGADLLLGGLGNDVLIGGVDDDTLRGGAGADSYRFAVGSGVDIVDDSAGATEDASADEITFETGIAPADIELRLGPNSGEPDLVIANRVTGDQITVRNYFGAEFGQSTSDHIEQIRFADSTVWGSAEILARVTQIVGTEADDVLNGVGSLDSRLFGLGGNDILNGGSGDDELDGGSGDDQMQGGIGSDTYDVDSTGDILTEFPDIGVDLVRASVNWTLGTDFENLTLTGATAINGTGNSLANIVIGNAGNNVLNGMAGADTLIGGAGNDTYVVDNAGEIVTENAGEGTDLVQTSLAHTLAANLENLTLTGSSAVNATGNDLANVIVGNGGANVIDGGAGADDMTGGSGNDTFVVDNAGDIVRESSGGGTDTIRSSITLTTLAANVEHVTLIGSDNINAVGGSGNNTLTGNSGNNRLDGGAGTDTLIGGLGNDTYVVNSTTDTITELAGQGIDTVESSVSFSINTTAMQSVVENITLTGTTANTTATGNALDNVLTGTSVVNTLTGNDGHDTLTGLGGNDTLNGGNGNDILDGGTGNDAMTGGAGNDTFVVDSTTDTVTEASGGGTDTIQTSVQITTWAANVENMTLLGSGNLTTPTTTSSANNVIVGNAGNNTLNGGAGDDTINGSGGTDSLVGGTGADTYQYLAGGGTDTIDNAAADSLVDRLRFLDLASDQIMLSRTGNNLVMTRVGVATDKVTVTNWFSAAGNRIDFVNFTNREVTAAEIDTLVNGGGGSFPLSVFQSGLETMAVAGGGRAAGGPTAYRMLDELGDPMLALTKQNHAFDSVRWQPIKAFDVGTDNDWNTLGGKLAAGDKRVWQPIKTFSDQVASLGVNRLVDAMTFFGAEATLVTSDAEASDTFRSNALESLAVHQEMSRTHRFHSEFRAVIE
jgi:Ca2+-binding RTX toxin-like protein